MRIVIVSDLHANRHALEAVQRAVGDSCEAWLCLGDLVNYGPHPGDCVRWAQAALAPGWCVQGNHDLAVGRDVDPRCSPAYRAAATAMQRFTMASLPTDAREWLAGLPAHTELSFGGARLHACHATPSDPHFTYMPGDAPLERWTAELERANRPDFLLVGHTHLPFVRKVGRTLVVNPGSLGQPKDGDRRACFAIWDDGEVELRRVDYDVHAVVRDYSGRVPPSVVLALANVLLTGGALPVHQPAA